MTHEKPGLLWSQPDWQAQAHAWITTQLDALGLQAVGPIEQPHIRPWSTVMRVPTRQGLLFFKAGAAAFAQEAALTAVLSRRLSEGTPRVLAAAPERGWLLMADGGVTMRSLLQTDQDITHWYRVLPLYASLQQQMSEYVEDLAALGVPDRRLTLLPSLYNQLLEDMPVLCLDQPECLTTEEYKSLLALRPWFAARCEQLAESGIPESVQHDDLHDNNILVSEGRYVVFDWGDCCLAHPFFSMLVVLRSAGHTLQREAEDPAVQSLREVYLRQWTRYAPYESLERTCALAQQPAMLCRALTWYRLVCGMDEPLKTEYAAYVSGWLQEFAHACADAG